MNILQRIQPPVYLIDKVAFPDAKTFCLDNKVPGFLIEAGTEDIMRIEFIFKAGQVKEKIPLLASTTNAMLSEGSENYSSEELNRLLDYHGVFLSLSAEKDSAGIVLYCLTRQLKKVLELSREIIFRPVFPEPELNSLMKKRYQWYLVNREKVQNMATDQYFESVFGKDHPYGHKIAEKDFENINQSLLKEFHSKYYSPDNMAIIISGKIDEKTTELLNCNFGDIIAPSGITEDIPVMPKGENRKKIYISKKGAIQSAIRIGSSTINKRHPDYPGLKFLDTILGGYFGSRLMKNIREEKGYTYGINSSLSSLDLSGYKLISAEVGKKNCRKAIDEIFKEIILLQSVPLNSNEITVVRNVMSGEMVRMFDGPFALAESFKSIWEFGLDNEYYHRLTEKINTIDSDEIIRLARTYYNINELYEITAG